MILHPVNQRVTTPPGVERLRRCLLTVALLLVSTITFHSHALQFSHSLPANNSEISTFDFEIVFNIEDALDSYVCSDYGIYVSGSYSEKTGSGYHTKLYKGTIEDGEIIGRALTANVTATSADFEQGNSLHLNFVGIMPEEGQVYTLALYNKFNITSPTLGGTAGTVLNCNKTPIVLTFIGATAKKDELVLQSSSLSTNENVVSLNCVQLGYNEAIKICEGAAMPYFAEGNETYATATATGVESADDKMLNITFADTEFPVKRNFTFVLPAGSVCLASDEDVKNEELRIPIVGSKYEYFELTSLTPESNGVTVPPAVKVAYNLPDGTVFRDDVYYYGTLYKINGTEREKIEEIKSSAEYESKEMKWTFKNAFEPETTYEFEIPQGTIFGYVTDWSTLTGYKKVDTMSNDEILIRFTTPAIKNNGLPEMQFNDPRVALKDDDAETFKNGSTVYEMNGVSIALKDMYYNYAGCNVKLILAEGEQTAKLYKTAEEGDVELKEMKLSTMSRYSLDADDNYRVLYVPVHSRFYEGETYKLVIPTGAVTVESEPLKAYVKNPEVVFTYTGTAEGTLKLTCASLREGERLTTLSAVAFHTDQELAFTDATPMAYLKDAQDNIKAQTQLTLMVTSQTKDGVKRDVTRVMGDFSVFDTMMPYTLPNADTEYKVVLPAGILCLATDADVKNREIVVNIKRVAETGIPEYVNLTTVHSDHVATTVVIEKGLTAKLQLTPDAYWKVDKLLFNDNDVTADVAEDGTYTTEALSADARLEAKLAFDGDLVVAESTDVPAVIADGVKVYSNGEEIVAEGVAAGTELTLYTVSGHVVKTHTTENDIVKITAPTGIVYILRIGDQAVKVMH